MPFVWGSAQLDGNPVLRPKSIHNPDVLETYGKEYLYLGAVHFVTQVRLQHPAYIINSPACYPPLGYFYFGGTHLMMTYLDAHAAKPLPTNASPLGGRTIA
jgi:Phosphotyrosyl phosphate activator (PTPA) protein